MLTLLLSKNANRALFAPHRLARNILLVFAVVLVLAGCACSNTASQGSSNDASSSTEEETLVDNPIDFAALQAQNPDICGWLDFPGMDISRPIFRSSFDDVDFYLWHDINGNASGIGEAYMQPFNNKDFNDPVTLIYGHSIAGTDVAFTNLHRLEDRTNFDAYEYFYIFTPNRILTYQVVTIQIVPDTHILKNDFSTAEGQQSYFDKLLNPTEGISFVRDGVMLIGGESKLVHLVTCTIPDEESSRYIVGGLLVSEQKTK